MNTKHYRIGSRYLGVFGDGAVPSNKDAVECTAPSHANDTWNGSEWTPSTVKQISDYQSAIQHHLDTAARSAGYDDISTAVTYATEPAVPRFQQEGQVFRAWRSLVWAYGYEQLALVKSGQRPAPTITKFIAELPPLELPAPITAGQE